MFKQISNWWQRSKLTNQIEESENIKLIVGASGTKQSGWLETEEGILDITNKTDWEKLLGKKKVKNILAEHVLEHLTQKEILATLENTFEYLAPNGVFRVAVPDGYHPSKYVIDLTKPNGLEPGADDHKVLLNIDIMKEMTRRVGFRLKPREYFDKDGYFHSTKWADRDGYVSRSSKNYKGRFTDDKGEYKKFYDSIPNKLRSQFVDKNMSYTSLFVDFLKP